MTAHTSRTGRLASTLSLSAGFLRGSVRLDTGARSVRPRSHIVAASVPCILPAWATPGRLAPANDYRGIAVGRSRPVEPNSTTTEREAAENERAPAAAPGALPVRRCALRGDPVGRPCGTAVLRGVSSALPPHPPFPAGARLVTRTLEPVARAVKRTGQVAVNLRQVHLQIAQPCRLRGEIAAIDRWELAMSLLGDCAANACSCRLRA